MDKKGRPRRYDVAARPGFRSAELALEAAMLQELAERVYDQIEDLPLHALDFHPEGANLSIARLVAHLASAEASWVSRLTGVEIPSSLRGRLEPGSVQRFAEPPESVGTAAELIALCRDVQQTYSEPALREVEEIDRVFEAGGRTVSVRGVIGQLNWHWVYHSGQIGLLRLQWGSDYHWTNDTIVGTPRR